MRGEQSEQGKARQQVLLSAVLVAVCVAALIFDVIDLIRTPPEVTS